MMEQLSKTEEQLMEYLWKLEKAFMKDLLEAFPDPKPASTTVATLLKRMIDKKFVDYNTYGNVREYYPLVKKQDYFSDHIKGLIKNFFNNSSAQFASFFTSETNLSEKELQELKKIVDKQIKMKKK
jgi:BlaI family transcriptional regulator, penicillinase repressor